jgi:cation diffusion facilitator CzcD-associated flavoprotein CzcO
MATGTQNGRRPAQYEPLTPDHEIAIIGAGLSGIGMAAALLRAGMDEFVLFERAADVGGTWRDNTYPGVGVDIPTFTYQFSYDLKPDWSRFFAKGAEVKGYIDGFVERHGVLPHVRFDSEVTERVWDEEARVWRLRVNGEEVTARFVISAIGPFVDPKPIEIPGVEDFQGKVIHSARWDHDYDLKGRRVAIVGTGASAVQIVPTIAPDVAQLDVYQRTPIWVLPKFDPKIPQPVQNVFRRLPFTQQLLRLGLTGIVEFILVFLVVNYRWVKLFAPIIDQRNRRFVASQVKDPVLREKLTPKYGLGCKRPSTSNHYLRTFNRENVELVTEPIEAITPTGVRTADGREREVDVLVLATGFRLASDPENFRRTPVRGRDGVDLATLYEEHRLRSYEGISMPELPNHFMLFGPYGWTGASWHVLVETVSHHIIRVIEEARRRGATMVAVTPQATERFFGFVEHRVARSLWFTSNCETANSYYFDHHGDAPFLRPTSGLQAMRACRTFPLDDYSYR